MFYFILFMFCLHSLLPPFSKLTRVFHVFTYITSYFKNKYFMSTLFLKIYHISQSTFNFVSNHLFSLLYKNPYKLILDKHVFPFFLIITCSFHWYHLSIFLSLYLLRNLNPPFCHLGP